MSCWSRAGRSIGRHLYIEGEFGSVAVQHPFLKFLGTKLPGAGRGLCVVPPVLLVDLRFCLLAEGCPEPSWLWALLCILSKVLTCGSFSCLRLRPLIPACPDILENNLFLASFPVLCVFSEGCCVFGGSSTGGNILSLLLHRDSVLEALSGQTYGNGCELPEYLLHQDCALTGGALGLCLCSLAKGFSLIKAIFSQPAAGYLKGRNGGRRRGSQDPSPSPEALKTCQVTPSPRCFGLLQWQLLLRHRFQPCCYGFKHVGPLTRSGRGSCWKGQGGTFSRRCLCSFLARHPGLLV